MKNIFTYTIMALMAMIAFTSCEEDDHYLAETLMNRDWQGSLGVYYNSHWSLSGEEYATVMRFEAVDTYATSGRGYELDFNTRSRYNDYAYCEFSWAIVDHDIIIIYDDNIWKTTYIHDYRLYSNSFRGYIDDGTNRNIYFDLANQPFDDWGSYGYRSYYGARGENAFDAATDSVPYIDSGKSIVSGEFALSYQKRLSNAVNN